MTNPKRIPDGYRQDARGHLVPIESIKEIDLLRDQLVSTIIDRAKGQSGQLSAFKNEIMAQIDDFVDTSAARFGAKRLGGKKGNITLLSFDGAMKVVLAINETLVFDERLQIARDLILKCIQDWSEGSSPEIVTLINDAFQVDKAGNISVSRVLGLRRLDITDKRWLRAMNAISESIQIASSKRYIRMYERVGDSDEYAPITLDVAGA